MLLGLRNSPALPTVKWCVLMPQPPGLQEEAFSPRLPDPKGCSQCRASGLLNGATHFSGQLARADIWYFLIKESMGWP